MYKFNQIIFDSFNQIFYLNLTQGLLRVSKSALKQQ
jgi:3-isopropylmalate dehydratase small subunit